MEDFTFKYISIKTQVRRLKYFSVFLERLNEKGTRKDFIQSSIISWSESSNLEFSKLTSKTGEINRNKNKEKSISFENYYEAIKKFGLINDQNEFVSPSRIGAVFKSLQKIFYGINEKQDYLLNELETIFFLYLILLNDKDYFLSNMELIHEYPCQNQDFYLENFQKFYIKRLEEKVRFVSQNDRDKMIDSLTRVRNWRSAKRYCEDIVSPRINWMIDLGLIDKEVFSNERRIKLNEIGETMVFLIKSSFIEVFDISNKWLEEQYISFFSRTFFGSKKFKLWIDLNEEEKTLLVNEIIDKAYVNFNVLGLPRISLEQFLLFGIMFSFSKNILIEQKDLQVWVGFEKILLNKKIGIRASARQNESYIIVNEF